jgi:hypothetical protein
VKDVKDGILIFLIIVACYVVAYEVFINYVNGQLLGGSDK